jgi:hypothetical protein
MFEDPLRRGVAEFASALAPIFTPEPVASADSGVIEPRAGETA